MRTGYCLFRFKHYWRLSHLCRCISKQAQEDHIQQIVQQEAELEGQTYQQKLNEQAEIQRLRARQQQLESLQEQLNEIHLREEEAKKLVSKENALADDLALLDKLEKDRRAIEDHCKRELYGRALLRQHHSAIRRRSAVVQAELEADLAWLAQLESQKTADAKAEAERKKLTQQNIKAMRELLEADLNKERKQEIELDAMQSHEATKWWAKREQEWRNEAEARQQLLREVLEERRSQIAEQLEKVRHQQQEELQSREALLETLERAKNEDAIQSEKRLEADEAYRAGLDVQAEEKRASSAYALKQSELEKLETVKAEEAYEELLKQEAEQLRSTESAKDRSISSRQTHFPYQWSKPGGNIW
ncbi:Trichoplein keratin filament-binding protein [Paragonimus skrjabini miyazakii]|uniref:Trichoplein keratin filament-binding protein n=1 Tax=Paragonimus skrjabini miyazakii TaxID=59628 RepID=A0A8S9YGG5_9TREM|nr:Trichoplein keratin filament-binding protein [Paragonimus skrjabini miyazakii]